MPASFDPRKSTTAFDQLSTLVVVLELSAKTWLAGALVPGISRWPRKSLAAGDFGALTKLIDRWKDEAVNAGRPISRIAVAYETGRDGFWIARVLQGLGIEVYVMHAASVAQEQGGRRAKTDRTDLELLLTRFIGWLRGEPRQCSMVPIPSEAEEDMREEGRRRDAIGAARLKVENQIGSLLVRFGITDFRPRLKKAEQKLEALRTFDGRPLPANTMDSLRRLMAQQRLLSAQLKEIEAAREAVKTLANPDRIQKMIQMLAAIHGLGIETATTLVHEVFSRQFRDRKALGGFVGITGTPYDSGNSKREQGMSKRGSPRARKILTQLVWRWQKFQPDSVLTQWFVARTGGAKGRIKKIMAMAMARKLLIALWRYVDAGVIPQGVRLAGA